MTTSPLGQLGLALALSCAGIAQVPTPNPQPRTAPRAEWVATPGVTGTVPPNRHWSQPANSPTQMFVFAGRNGSGAGPLRNDLWAFDGVSLSWTELTTDGDPSAPPARFRNGCTYDPLNDRLVVFGGEDPSGTLLNDTWQYSFITNTWTSLGTGGPSARRFTRLAYDPSSLGVVLFGGQDAAGNPLGDTWILAGGAWAAITPGASAPARGLHHLVTRPDTGDVFLCGGQDFAPTNRIHFTDVWVWDINSPNGWSPIAATTTAIPHGVFGNNAVYDQARRRVILQGGQGISTAFNETGGAYGTAYGGSPSNWTSEWDCVTNEWLLYGAAGFNTGDPVIGRSSRYYTAFLETEDKIYKWGGQNPSGVGVPLTTLKEYQANPIADSTPLGVGCSGLAGGPITMTAQDRAWIGRSLTMDVDGLAPVSLVFTVLGFTPGSTPLSALLPGAGLAGCTLETDIIDSITLTNTGGSAQLIFGLPVRPSLVGVQVNFQTLQVESPGLSITGFSSSNGLRLTLGVL
ncbi:MAG: kelch repeat-containing protein [Planctomycetota bacterium]